MPEQLTKHPEISLEVLASAGAQCARGARPEILKTCPAERFCKLPGGEICVYGLPDAGRMTQLSQADWSTLLASVGLAPPPSVPAPAPAGGSGAIGIGALALLAGIVIGAAAVRARELRR